MKPKIIDDRNLPRNRDRIPSATPNAHKFVAIHYKGVTADDVGLYGSGYGGHFDVQHDGTIHQNADITKTIWAVGKGDNWQYIHPSARNQNTVSIEANCYCDGPAKSIYEKTWYYTDATQESMAQTAAWLLFDVLGYPVTAHTVSAYLLRHGDITTKPCPACYFASAGYKKNWGWDAFRKRVLDIGLSWIGGGTDYMFDVKQIKKGDSSADVTLWQKILVAEGIKGKDKKTIAMDGIFGDNTDYATRKYQEKHGLVVDGIVGPKTWKEGLGV